MWRTFSVEKCSNVCDRELSQFTLGWVGDCCERRLKLFGEALGGFLGRRALGPQFCDVLMMDFDPVGTTRPTGRLCHDDVACIAVHGSGLSSVSPQPLQAPDSRLEGILARPRSGTPLHLRRVILLHGMHISVDNMLPLEPRHMQLNTIINVTLMTDQNWSFHS